MKNFKNNELYMKNTFGIVKELCDKKGIKCQQISKNEFIIDMKKVNEIKRIERPTCLQDLTTRKDGKQC